MSLDTKAMTVAELTEAVIPFIENKNYSKAYINGLRRVFNRLKEYCIENEISTFSTELGQQFLNDRYKIEPGSVSRQFSRAHRAMDMLSDFQLFGAVMIRRRLEREFPEQFSQQAGAYLVQMEKDYARPNTVLSHKKSLYKFTDFLDSVGVDAISDLTVENVNNYIKAVLCNYGKSVARLHFGIMRKFLKFLYESGDLKEDLSIKLVSVKFGSAPSHLPSTFLPEEIEKILDSVDRESPAGKRDYAVLMLATKLGLRTSDIRNLRPENIDWTNHKIRITQVKTGEPLILPLTADVGWALIDYIKNGRPVSDAPEIFLRAAAPYISLQNFDNILVKHMRIAGIEQKAHKHHGLHTLRHSLATHMLEQEIPITTIQDVLGHINAETTKKYTSVDVQQLKECALEVPEL